MKLARGLRWMVLVAAALLAGGCALRGRTLVSAFPQASEAPPWVLDGRGWSGSFAQAAIGLGPDAEQWRPHRPVQVWLAVYRHQTAADRKLTVRAMAFDTRESARRAYEHFQPDDARAFRAGEEGCWTEIGVLFVWGRLVFDIFGSRASWRSEVQAAAMTGFIQSHMPRGLPDAPR